CNNLRRCTNTVCQFDAALARGCAVQGVKGYIGTACDTLGRAKTWLVILIGNFQTFKLLGVSVHPHAVVIKAQIHRRSLWRPHPQGCLCQGCARLANINLRGMQLPEVAHSEQDAASYTANIGNTRRSLALISIDPGMAGFGALLNTEAVGVQLRQGVI